LWSKNLKNKREKNINREAGYPTKDCVLGGGIRLNAASQEGRLLVGCRRVPEKKEREDREMRSERRQALKTEGGGGRAQEKANKKRNFCAKGQTNGALMSKKNRKNMGGGKSASTLAA